MLYDQLRQASPFFLIAGPCVIESEHLLLKTAETLKQYCSALGIPLIYKSSYAKANRTAVTSYKGVGIEEGLRLLQKVKEQLELPLITDVHETQEVLPVSEVCDIIQIPAFLSRQTALLQACALTGRIVNIKKGQFMAPEDVVTAAAKVTSCNNSRVLLTERGSSFGYHNLVVDFRSFAIMQESGFPVVYDVTHSLQRPSEGTVSGGTPQYVPMMAAAALATGCVQGLFIETHPSPAHALSDAASMLPLKQMPALLQRCADIAQAAQKK